MIDLTTHQGVLILYQPEPGTPKSNRHSLLYSSTYPKSLQILFDGPSLEFQTSARKEQERAEGPGFRGYVHVATHVCCFLVVPKMESAVRDPQIRLFASFPSAALKLNSAKQDYRVEMEAGWTK